MSTEHFRNSETNEYIGGFGHGAKPDPALNPVACPAPDSGLDLWSDTGWVSAPPDPNNCPLTSAQFTWLTSVSGLDDATDAVLAHAKATDRELFADLKMA
ncbi:MAG: hypothetical protein HRU33_20755 [Rhodobacteraceae bacterium]|nr:hypothetical protein [Paracoccaceae bacterium]